MATLIPALATCTGRMTPGERRFAQRLEAKLEEDYLCWYDVPVGPSALHPDFLVLHPKRGLVVLEVKDWKLDTIRSITRSDASLLTNTGLKHVANPLEQARHYAHAVADSLKRDPQLIFSSGRMQGQLMFPWAYGLVLTNITRKAFDATDLGEVLTSTRVICQDEMTDSVDAEVFQQRLWNMFSVGGYGNLTLPQIDRIRWHLFPEIRVPERNQPDLLEQEEAPPALPDLMAVMDLQQEQLARSLGEGHRVIHGVAGSGKTLILGYRAEHLARACAKPVLILCYNKALAHRLTHWIAQRSLAGKVHVRNFHAWCHQQLKAFGVELPGGPASRDGYWNELVEHVIRGVDRGLIPRAQYDAVLIDEGHDFLPEWLKLVVQMVDPSTNALLLLYDDAQSIYHAKRKPSFSFRSVGIQAQGRTTILRVNYRNTREILAFARHFCAGLLTPNEADEDGVPLLAPVSGGRQGQMPRLVRLPHLRAEAEFLIKHLNSAREQGRAWSDMAILYRHWQDGGKFIHDQLKRAGVPLTWKDDIRFDSSQDTVRMLPMHSSKGLEFPLVAIPHVTLPSADQPLPDDEARLLYVAMTRALDELVVLGHETSSSATSTQ